MNIQEDDSQEAFNRRWDLDDLPACEVGMVLLFRFAKAYPVEYGALRPADLLDFRNSPLTGIREWDDFAEHSSTCDDCNEV